MIYTEPSECEKDLIPKMVKLIKLLLVNPTTPWVPEQSFSTARRYSQEILYYLAFISSSYVYCLYFSNVFMKDLFSSENIIFHFVLLFLFNLLWFTLLARFGKFVHLAHKTVSLALHQARKLRNKHHLITVRFLYTSKLMKIL